MIKLHPRQNLDAIVDDLEALFLRFLALNEGLALVLTLWSLATHLFDVFDAFPYLGVTSPTKRCGKTRVCELISCVCLQPLQTVNISAAALYRLLGEGNRTFLIDEAESLGRPKDERTAALREILNSGYRKGAVVVRCTRKMKSNGAENETEDGFGTEQFNTYCPKAVVAIGRLQDTLADRCIEIRMERRMGVKLDRFLLARTQKETCSLQRTAELWACYNRRQVEDYYQNNDLSFLHDREAELWLPLFAVCAIAAPWRLPDLESVALQLAGAKSAEEPMEYNVQVLRDCRDVFAANRADKLPTAALLESLNAAEDRPWAGWFGGQGLSAYGLSKLLRSFQIQPQNIRIGVQVVKGYWRQSFQEAWDRYL
jgi:hypothetical protein